MSTWGQGDLGRFLFGVAARRAFVDYASTIGAVLFILLMIAWTIDLAGQLNELQRVAKDRNTGFAAIAAPYLGYRTVDIVTRLLPMACFFGAFIAEIRRRVAFETVILSAAGASTLRLMMGALWLGLILGAVQTALEAKWRPAAIWAQVEFGVGGYARRFGDGWLPGPRWIVTDGRALRGDVQRGSEPEMRNVLLFSGTGGEELDQVLSANRMAPAETRFDWQLTGVTAWASGDAQGTLVDDQTIRLDIVPETLRYFGVLEFNLPTHALHALRSQPNSVPTPGADTALWRRRTAGALPLALILLGSVLARAGFDGRRAVLPRLIALAALGYVLVVSIKVFWKVGEHGSLAAPLAATAGVGLALFAAIGIARIRW